MSVEDEVAALRSRMEMTSREHSERAALSTKSVENAVAEGKDKAEKALKTAAAVAGRLHERTLKEKAAGGWGTEAATKEKSGEFHFGGEDDEEEPQDEFARYRSPSVARPTPPEVVPEPAPAPPPPPAAPAWAPPAGRGAPARRPQRPTVDDDDDLSGQSWLT